jgi:signal transduction histidine kinase
VDLLRVARAVAASLASLGVPIEVSGGPAWAAADACHLRRALASVVDNAVKASPPGGHVDVFVWTRDGRAGLSVTDAGPGIPASERERIFERFARLDAARGRGGSGLGLAIARELVEGDGGRVTVDADSTFVIELPVSAAAAGSPWAPAPSA